MTDDVELLRSYVETGAEAAFAELVRRKVDLVHSAALRQVNGDSRLAEEVTQTVFIDLARKARSLTHHTSLAGWLYTSTRFAAAKAVRSRRRWQDRNREAQAMHDIVDSTASIEPGWGQLRPVLDAALADLGTRDREALLLRYFEDHPLAQVGARIGLSENAARMRVDRALDKLRAALARRGVTSSAAALSLALSQQAVIAAPVGLAASVTGAALAGAAAAGGIVAGAKLLSLMAMTKLQAGAAGVIGLALAAALFLQHQDNTRLQADNDRLHRQDQEVAALRADNRRLANQLAVASRSPRPVVAGNLPPPGTAGPLVRTQAVAGGAFTRVFSTSDPEMARLMDIQQRGQLEARYGALFKALDLSPAQRDQFKKLLLDRQNLTRDVFAAGKAQGLSDDDIRANLPAMLEKSRADLDSGIRDLLGDAGYQQYQQYQNTLPQRSLVDQLASRLNSTATPLTSQQTEQLVQILAANSPVPAPMDISSAPGFVDNMIFHSALTTASDGPGAAPVIAFSSGGLSSGAGTISDSAVNQAQGILAPAQLEALQQLQTEQQAAQNLSQRMMTTLPALPAPGGN
jgi:RNA polymerase sigma factor (sigma-70 family)